MKDIVAVVAMTGVIALLLIVTAIIAGTWVGIAATAMQAWIR